MPLTAENWPITAAMLPFPGATPGGVSVNDADPSVWVEALQEVADAGFANVDLTDSWLKPGNLSTARLDEFKAALGEVGIGAPTVSAIRQSVIDERNWQENLAYSHRTIDAAAYLGMEVVSVGLHQALTDEQKKQLWFWTVDGHKDPENDPETWNKCVTRLRELGDHAADVGVLLSLEMYEDTYVGTGDLASKLVQDIGLHNVGLNPDLGNLIRRHGPIEDWRELAAKVLPFTNFWHVKNYSRDEDVARGYYVAIPALLETGLMSYRELIKMAISVGFQGIISAEHYGGDGLTVSATNQAYLRGFVLPKRDGYALGTSQVAQTTAELSSRGSALQDLVTK